MQLRRCIDEDNPENIIDASVRRQKERAVGQLSMFDLFSDVAGFSTDIPAPDGIEWDRNLKLAFEHEMLGIYVSDHPLRPYEYALAKARDFTMGDIEASEEVPDPATGATRTRYKVPEGRTIRLAGMVTGLSKKNTKNGDPMAVFTLEDMEGEVSCVCFPKLYRQCAAALAGQVDAETGETTGNVFVKASGKLERSDRGDQFICSNIEPLVLSDEANRAKVIEINIPARMLSRTRMDELGAMFGRYRGMDRVELRVEGSSGETMRMELPSRVHAHNMVLLAEIADLFERLATVRVV